MSRYIRAKIYVRDRPHSRFHRYVERNMLPADSGGDVHDIKGAFGE